MAKNDKWSNISGQMARIADQGRAEREASKAHEAMTSKPDKAKAESVGEARAFLAAAHAAPDAEARAPEAIVQEPKPAGEPMPAAPRDEPPAIPKTKPAAVAKVAVKDKPAPMPEPAVELEKAKKKSTSLYLSGAASRALHTIAAQQGVRPHRVLDDALRAEFRKHGLDFDELNAKD